MHTTRNRLLLLCFTVAFASGNADNLFYRIGCVLTNRHDECPGEIDVGSPEVPTPSPTDSEFDLTFPPTAAPTPACEVDALTGEYGATTGSFVVVDYAYELEIDTGTEVTEVVPPLENAFNNYILPDVFPSDCTERRSLRTTLKDHHRRLKATGVSPLPTDSRLIDVECGDQEVGRACSVMKGGITVYVDGDSSGIDANVRAALKDGMDKGYFDDAHTNIHRVSYVELASIPDPGLPPEEGTGDGNSQLGEEGNGALVWGIIAGTATLLLAGMAVVWQRRRNNRKNEEDSALSTEGPTTEVNAPTEDLFPPEV